MQLIILLCLLRQSVAIVTPNDASLSSQSPSRTNPKAVIQSIERLGLAFSLQESLLSSGNENIVNSPLSIGALLGVILLASRRDTFDEIKNTMGLQSLSEEEIHNSYRRILGSIVSKDKGVVLRIASRLFVQDGLSLDNQYLQISQAMYNITVGGADFQSRGAQARQDINQWVSDRTNHKIPRLFQRNFSPSTLLVAVSAVYFNGKWEIPFNPIFTETGVFHTGNGRSKRLPFMRNIVDINHTSHKKIPSTKTCNIGHFDIIALPYEGEQFSMYIIRPEGEASVNKLTQIERSLSPNCLNSLIGSMTPQKVSIQIPRMRFSSRMSLKSHLQRMGANAIFDPQRVDFGRMSSHEGMFINDIVHEATIEMTELGTEAAAATGTSYDRIGGNLAFVLDVPSIVFIRDNSNGIMLFYAKVVNPSASA